MLKVSHVNLWVRDQDEAIAFYTEKLGCDLQEDVTIEEMGGFRWVTVSPPGQPDLRLILMPPSAMPASLETIRAASSSELLSSDGRGRGARIRPGGLVPAIR